MQLLGCSLDRARLAWRRGRDSLVGWRRRIGADFLAASKGRNQLPGDLRHLAEGLDHLVVSSRLAEASGELLQATLGGDGVLVQRGGSGRCGWGRNLRGLRGCRGSGWYGHYVNCITSRVLGGRRRRDVGLARVETACALVGRNLYGRVRLGGSAARGALCAAGAGGRLARELCDRGLAL